MPVIDFKYVPTSGDLSGKSFEEQTQMAFNELGQDISDISDSSAEAIATAENALSIANTALNSVNSAVQAANEATAAATVATETANQATEIANNATMVANNAADAAAVANTKADQASGQAQNALVASQNAQSAAESAALSAQNAESIANSIAESTARFVPFVAVDDKRIVLDNNKELQGAAFSDDPESEEVVPIDIAKVSVGDVVTLGDSEYPLHLLSSQRPTAQVGSDAVQSVAFLSDIVGAVTGKIDLMPFRAAELPSGWYFCNGDQYALTSAQGQALNGLSANFKADWGITVSGSNISLPNLFYTDGRGVVLRTVSGSARLPGSIEQDAMQNLGTMSANFYTNGSGTQGPFSFGSSSASVQTGTTSNWRTMAFNPANSVRVDTETRGLNIGMTPAIYLGV